jgi:hypothetical protein
MSAILFTFILHINTLEYECVRWTWSGDVYNRKVVCLEWKKKDSKK